MYQVNDMNFFGEDVEFDHAGFVVKSIDNAFKNATKILDPVQKVYVTFINIHNFKVELVEPLNDFSPVTHILKKGHNIYHTCFKVKNIREAIEIARKNGFHCIGKPVSATAFEGKKIAWVFSRNYGLIELLEK
jgi:methylmalonyl-CoA/ethylmalonyl-CoA epimerase